MTKSAVCFCTRRGNKGDNEAAERIDSAALLCYDREYTVPVQSGNPRFTDFATDSYPIVCRRLVERNRKKW